MSGKTVLLVDRNFLIGYPKHLRNSTYTGAGDARFGGHPALKARWGGSIGSVDRWRSSMGRYYSWNQGTTSDDFTEFKFLRTDGPYTDVQMAPANSSGQSILGLVNEGNGADAQNASSLFVVPVDLSKQFSRVSTTYPGTTAAQWIASEDGFISLDSNVGGTTAAQYIAVAIPGTATYTVNYGPPAGSALPRIFGTPVDIDLRDYQINTPRSIDVASGHGGLFTYSPVAWREKLKLKANEDVWDDWTPIASAERQELLNLPSSENWRLYMEGEESLGSGANWYGVLRRGPGVSNIEKGFFDHAHEFVIPYENQASDFKITCEYNYYHKDYEIWSTNPSTQESDLAHGYIESFYYLKGPAATPGWDMAFQSPVSQEEMLSTYDKISGVMTYASQGPASAAAGSADEIAGAIFTLPPAPLNVKDAGYFSTLGDETKRNYLSYLSSLSPSELNGSNAATQKKNMLEHIGFSYHCFSNLSTTAGASLYQSWNSKLLSLDDPSIFGAEPLTKPYPFSVNISFNTAPSSPNFRSMVLGDPNPGGAFHRYGVYDFMIYEIMKAKILENSDISQPVPGLRGFQEYPFSAKIYDSAADTLAYQGFDHTNGGDFTDGGGNRGPYPAKVIDIPLDILNPNNIQVENWGAGVHSFGYAQTDGAGSQAWGLDIYSPSFWSFGRVGQNDYRQNGGCIIDGKGIIIGNKINSDSWPPVHDPGGVGGQVTILGDILDNNNFIAPGHNYTNNWQQTIEDFYAFLIQEENSAWGESRPRSFEKMMNGTKAYCETIAFRLAKHKVGVNSIGQEVVSPDPIQNIYFPNPVNLDKIEYVDTQIKFGEKYKYKLYAYNVVVGNEYNYRNLQVRPPGSPPYSSWPNRMSSVMQFDVNNEAFNGHNVPPYQALGGFSSLQFSPLIRRLAPTATEETPLPPQATEQNNSFMEWTGPPRPESTDADDPMSPYLYPFFLDVTERIVDPSATGLAWANAGSQSDVGAFDVELNPDYSYTEEGVVSVSIPIKELYIASLGLFHPAESLSEWGTSFVYPNSLPVHQLAQEIETALNASDLQLTYRVRFVYSVDPQEFQGINQEDAALQSDTTGRFEIRTLQDVIKTVAQTQVLYGNPGPFSGQGVADYITFWNAWGILDSMGVEWDNDIGQWQAPPASWIGDNTWRAWAQWKGQGDFRVDWQTGPHGYQPDYYWDQSDTGTATVEAHIAPSLKIFEVPYWEYNTIKMGDIPPIFPDVQFFPFRGHDNRVRILLNNQNFKYAMMPESINDSDHTAYEEYAISQGRSPGLSVSGLFVAYSGDPLIFGTDDYPASYEIYRLDSPPESYTDFADNLLATVETNIGAANGATAQSYNDTIVPNVNYYYTFRSIDTHGQISPPGPVYKFQMVDNNGLIYPEISTHLIQTRGEKKPLKKPLRKILHVGAAFAQSMISSIDSNLSSADLENPTAIPDLGPNSEALWTSYEDSVTPGPDKTFKIRLTSKQTGKKIDLNLNFISRKIENPHESD